MKLSELKNLDCLERNILYETGFNRIEEILNMRLIEMISIVRINILVIYSVLYALCEHYNLPEENGFMDAPFFDMGAYYDIDSNDLLFDPEDKCEDWEPKEERKYEPEIIDRDYWGNPVYAKPYVDDWDDWGEPSTKPFYNPHNEVLKNAGITTDEQLLKMTVGELLKIPYTDFEMLCDIADTVARIFYANFRISEKGIYTRKEAIKKRDWIMERIHTI